jgi:hypothetical protein
LLVGDNEIDLEVIAEDGITRIHYKVVVERAEKPAGILEFLQENLLWVIITLGIILFALLFFLFGKKRKRAKRPQNF